MTGSTRRVVNAVKAAVRRRRWLLLLLLPIEAVGETMAVDEEEDLLLQGGFPAHDSISW